MNERLETLLEDCGVPVDFGGVSGLGILDQPDDLVAGMVISTAYVLTATTDFLGDASNGDEITVDGYTFTVEEVRKIDDGAFVRVGLKPA